MLLGLYGRYFYIVYELNATSLGLPRTQGNYHTHSGDTVFSCKLLQQLYKGSQHLGAMRAEHGQSAVVPTSWSCAPTSVLRRTPHNPGIL